MKFGLVLPNFGPLGDTRELAELAYLAERSGWDGVFLTDTIQMEGTESLPASDPWIDLAAIAMRTERIRIGLIVSGVPRYRPWQLARQAVTLDHLSNGRLVLGVGSGDPHDRGFSAFSEEMDPRRRAEMLDESLDIIQGLWSGAPFRYRGDHFAIDEVTLLPAPLQSPRIPIWVGWTWPSPRPMRRAARWDGAVPFAIADDGSYTDLTAADIRRLKEFMEVQRDTRTPYDIVTYGPVLTALDDETAHATLREHAAAGATWTIEFIDPATDPNGLRAAIQRGAPSPVTTG
ncbi:MAG TPA: LLM class flavin-dependent oxidoreductase [Thermomicrobiales bacterium]|nr:LLM class flavin-dependent oxidoreductase [Thermomicrobiales bacterium]